MSLESELGGSSSEDASGPQVSIMKMRVQPSEQVGRFRGFAVNNQRMVIATEHGYVIRIDLRTNIQDIVQVSQKCGPVRTIGLDPVRGVHAFIGFSSGDNFYLSAQSDKPVPLRKLDGIVVTALAWDRDNKNVASTGDILLGTDAGGIFEASLENHGKTVNCRKIYDIKQLDTEPLDNDVQMAIHGLHFERLVHDRKFMVMAATLTRHYQFVGGPTLEQLFRTPPYNSNPPFRQMPGSLNYTELHLWGSPEEPSQRFAWLTEPVVVYGDLEFSGQGAGDVFLSQDRLRYPSILNEHGQRVSRVPCSMGITRYHFLLLYNNYFQVVNPLSKQMVYETELPPPGTSNLGQFLAVASDAHTSINYLLSDRAILKAQITGEDMNMWRIFLSHKKFREAKEASRSSAQRNKVLVVEADYRFEQGDYVAAAQIYAQSPRSFEEVALKLIKVGNREALIKFLIEKLRSMRENAKIQRTLICTWLTELFLDQLNQLKFEQQPAKLAEASHMFRAFLEQHRDDLDPATTEALISSHGRIDELLFFAEQIHDHSVTIGHHIQRKEWQLALDVMIQQQDPQSFYKHVPVLMRHLPGPTVSVLLQFTPGLDPSKLLPALVQFEASRPEDCEEPNEAVRYLQQVCRARKPGLPETAICKDMAVHNYLLSLYAKQSEEVQLLKFLEESQYIDLEYALRTCLRLERNQACIKIYGMMKQYSQAVEMALQWGTDDALDLAKANADQPESHSERKQLWLTIARHVLAKAVENEQGVRVAIQEFASHDLIRIEDILPFFPKDTLIDDFCDEICASLEKCNSPPIKLQPCFYNQKIERLKREMSEATRSASLIQQDITNLPNRFGYIHAEQRCMLSGLPLRDADFYLFPCGHAFLADKLVEKMCPYLNSEAQQQVEDLQAKLTSSIMPEEKKKAQESLDDIVAMECILCSDFMINSITQPFEMAEEDSIEWSL